MTFDPNDILTQAPDEAPLVLLFAPNGHGKSSFIASTNNPFVIDCEKKFKSKKEYSFYRPNNLEDVVGNLEYLLSQDKLDYGVIAIDTIDWLEKAIHDYLCKKYNATNIIDDKVKALNFQKGYIEAANTFFSDIYPLLDDIRKKHNIPIILTAQCASTKQDEADKDVYFMQDLRVHKELGEKISDLMEVKAYLQMRTHIDQKGKLIPTDERYLITRRIKGIAAKNNKDLPEEVPISYYNGWEDFVKAIGTCPPAN